MADVKELSINGTVYDIKDATARADILTKQNIMQYATLPVPSAILFGKIAQYVGNSTSVLTKGYFYRCENDNGTFKWAQIDVQPSSSGGGTVTSVNNVLPDSGGNVTLSIPADTSDLTNGAGYITAASVPTKVSDLTNDSGFITGIISSDVTAALGYTPYNSSNPNGYTSNIGTVTSVNNISPDGSGNVSLAMPTVNNATLTITQGGTTKGAFTANASSDVTIALDAGGGSIGFPDYASGISISSGHTCLSNGYVKGLSVFNAGVGRVEVNNIQVSYWNAASSAQFSFFIAVSKDDKVTFTNATGVVFFPCKE